MTKQQLLTNILQQTTTLAGLDDSEGSEAAMEMMVLREIASLISQRMMAIAREYDCDAAMQYCEQMAAVFQRSADTIRQHIDDINARVNREEDRKYGAKHGN